ncbi:ribonuclease H-like domain-containing protein [Tanacetum coccineum]
MAEVLINSLDVGNPLYLQPNDHSNMHIVSFKLYGFEKYKIWSTTMKIALKGKNKMGFVDGTYVRPVTSHVLSQHRKGVMPLFLVGFLVHCLKSCIWVSEIASEVWSELDETYDKIDGINLLAREPLPEVKDAFAIVSREESYRGLAFGKASIKNSHVAFMVRNDNNNNSNSNRRVNSNNNNNRGPNPNLMMKVLSLINEKPASNVSDNMSSIRPTFFNSNTYFNMQFEKFFCAKSNAYMYDVILGWIIDSGANQHITVSIKDMFNFVDISSLKLIVGHPNGTMAKITAIGSFRLTNNVVLFDVLVVLEYNDLKLGKIMGTGSESAGLYMFDCGDNGKSNVGVCNSGFVSHVSKDLWHCRLGHPIDTTREPFPLSDHKSVRLGDLIHLDVRGPYKVIVRSDNGTKFVNSNVLNLFNNYGIIHQTYCSYTLQQNEIAERKHRHLLNVARSLMFQARIPLGMWSECVLTATYLVNRLPSYVLPGASHFRLVYGKEPILSHLRAFRCLCYSTILNNHDKFGVSLPSPSDREGDLSNEDGNGCAASDGCLNTSNGEAVAITTQIEENVNSEGNGQNIQNGDGSNSLGVEPLAEVRRSSRNRTMHIEFNDFVVNSNVKYGLEKHVSYSKLSSVNFCFSTTLSKSMEPKSYIEAYLLVRRTTIGCKWLFKTNYKALGEVDKYKARLFAKGFSQRKGLDYEETVSPVGVYMSLPPGYYDNGETKVCRLVKSLYGLKQAPRRWKEKLTCALIEKWIHSRKYCLKLLSGYGLLACKPAAAPLQQKTVLCVEESEKDKYISSMIEYQKLVGKLIYLSVTRLDIAYVVHCLSQHMHAPLQSHFTAGLRVFRYLKQAPGTGISFNKGNKFSLNAYSDADWAKYRKTGKSVLDSVDDLDIVGLFPVNLYYDSSYVIQIAANPVFHDKTKHFEIDLHLS